MKATIVIVGLLGLANCEAVRFESIRPRVECLCDAPDATDGLADHDVLHVVARWSFGPSTVARASVADDDSDDN